MALGSASGARSRPSLPGSVALAVGGGRVWPSIALHPLVLELVALSLLLLPALLLRAEHLADIPRYTDEIDEVLPATDIAAGHGLPLVSGPKHIGAFFDYLAAAAILAFGKSPDLPRQVV